MSLNGRSPNGPVLYWQFKDGQPVACDPYCAQVPERYNYMSALEAPEVDYIIKAEIREGGFYQAHPRDMTVYAADLRLIHEAAVADFTSLEQAWLELNAVTAPVAAPAL